MNKEVFILSVNSFYELKQNSWAGALQTLEAIEEKGLQDQFVDLVNMIIESCEDQKIEETRLNDFIWFDTDFIEEELNVKLWND